MADGERIGAESAEGVEVIWGLRGLVSGSFMFISEVWAMVLYGFWRMEIRVFVVYECKEVEKVWGIVRLLVFGRFTVCMAFRLWHLLGCRGARW